MSDDLIPALITGASSGLGAHFGRVLAANGFHVILAARRKAKVTALADALNAEGKSAEAIELDVANAASVTAAFAAMSRAPDVVINNAGIAGEGTALEMPEEVFTQVLDTNLKGVFLVSQAAARAMKKRGSGGAIVNIASILGLRVAGGVSAYSASKAALVQLTRAQALEWARYGIRVNALCPGYIETPLNRAFFETDPLCRHMADLMVYLRQPAPDAQRVKTGAAAAAGHIELSL